MAVENDCKPVSVFEDWYIDYSIDERTGCLEYRGLSGVAESYNARYQDYKREMDIRVSNYEVLEMLADNEVISKKPDLPNISSGETAGIVRRIARNLVQNTPNVQVTSKHDDKSPSGIFSEFILKANIIGTDLYSNDMQQNLFSSTKTAFTLGFDCVTPVLLQRADGSWYIKYDTIHYRDVFPEPGAKDVRQATDVFVRRYLTPGEVKALIQDQPAGWDISALKDMLKVKPNNKELQSVDKQSKKHHTIPKGYEIITWYNSFGDNFLTFSANRKTLLRIEKNNHPLKEHPVFFLVLEKDSQQPLGKSQVELLLGRQEFQDLMLNGAMKMYYRNINPSIIGYGAVNSIPNLSPGKYTEIKNPNARIEPFEVSTQTLLQFGAISQQNLGSMVQLVGAADQQMASQNGNNGMSATPQGVEAQQQMVDITTNNYQKAIESFFSHYCSYALTIYFQEMKSFKKITPSAEARTALISSGIPLEEFEEDGTLNIDFKELATQYFVKCVPGSLVEMEDEKQLRLLQEFLVPLSQAMPAFSQSNDPGLMESAANTLQFIMSKLIQLSGINESKEMESRFKGQEDKVSEFDDIRQKSNELEENLSNFGATLIESSENQDLVIRSLRDQLTTQGEAIGLILQKLGVTNGPSEPEEDSFTE